MHLNMLFLDLILETTFQTNLVNFLQMFLYKISL